MEKLKERVSILEVKVDGLKTDTARFDGRFDQINKRFNRIDTEFVAIHGKFSKIYEKFSDTNRYIAEMKSSLEGRITDLHGKISDLHKSITNQTRWMVGILGSLTVSMIVALINMNIKLAAAIDILAEAVKK